MERLRKTWPEWARVAAPAVLVTAAVFLTIFATSFRVSIYPSGRWVSVDVQQNVAQAAITVTSLGTAQDKAGTSPWTAKTGLSLAVDDYVFVAEGADAAASKIIATRPYPDTASYGDYINALWGDSTHIYAGGITTNTIRKYLKSDLSYIGETASYGSEIYALWGDATHVYAGGAITNTVRKYSSLAYSLVADVTATNATHAVASIWSVRILETGTDFQIIVTNTSTAKAVTVYKASGIATTTPFDKSATNTGTGTSATVGPTATLSQADELIICATAVEDEIDDAHGSWTTGATYCSGNEQFDATNGGGDTSNIQAHSVAEVVTATTAQNAADGVHDSSSWAAAIATYKMASGYDISNTPTSKAFSIVAASSTYYAFGSAPSNPLQDSEATFTVTNNGAVTIDLDMKLADCTGGVGWNIASGSPGANEIRVTAYWSGQNPASGLVLANTDAEFYDALAASGTKKWDFKLETGSSFTDGVAKSCILTLTATAED